MKTMFLVAVWAVVWALPNDAATAQSAGPSWDWLTGSPESQGMSGQKLQAMTEVLAAHRTEMLLVIRNDTIVCEWYAPGFGPTNLHGIASMSKAVVGGVSVAVALTDGRLALDDKAARFIPQWRDAPRKSRITLRQLGSHTSGLADAEANGLPHERLSGWEGDFWKRLAPPHDPFTLARDITPLETDPGEKSSYSNPGIAMLAYAVTAALKDAPQKDLRTLLRHRVLRPIGLPDGQWSVGYGQTVVVDGLPLVAAWGGASFTPRAMARVGRLMLRQGDWQGKQLLSPEAVRAVTSDAGTGSTCGIGWWSNNRGRNDEGVVIQAPRDAFWAAGANHQIMLVVPSLKLIVVRFGRYLSAQEPNPWLDPVNSLLFGPVVGAVTGHDSPVSATAPAKTAQLLAPYPPSPVIERVDWAPKDTIIRKAHDSDNWPMTWADDDALYTAYGDGSGFEPFVPQKLSLGFAKVTGTPPAFLGENLRTPSLEQRGGGLKGRKASGLLCVDAVLYLWARNATNSQLAWSEDHGATWSWADWRLTNSLGCPTFLNFGRNYAGARDPFVYIYSPDSDSAYEVADRLVLARVPKTRIRERAAYEFFTGMDARQPGWSPDLTRRGAVFSAPALSYRVGISYSPVLNRFLMAQPIPTAASRDRSGKIDTRFAGGLAIYDAPAPWGPWTTAFFTSQWDVGPGDSASFPTKWMSADGRTLYLVFSWDDNFCVRQALITLHD
jgi:CubicO group peptidase (beta-lactamase class C family)